MQTRVGFSVEEVGKTLEGEAPSRRKERQHERGGSERGQGVVCVFCVRGEEGERVPILVRTSKATTHLSSLSGHFFC